VREKSRIVGISRGGRATIDFIAKKATRKVQIEQAEPEKVNKTQPQEKQ